MAETKRKGPPVPVIVVVALLAVGGAVWWWMTAFGPADDGVLRADGTIEATEYQVTPVLTAPIETVGVVRGDQVKKGDVIATLDATAAKLTQRQAEQGVVTAQAALDNVNNDKNSTKADKTAAQARLEQAKTAVELAKVQVGYATVTAPVDGVVTAVIGQPGQNATPSRAIITILDTADMFARVYVPEPSVGKVSVGQRVSLTTDSSDAEYIGTVVFIASRAEFTPNTIQTADQRAKLVYEARIKVTDSSGVLKAGMPATAAFT